MVWTTFSPGLLNKVVKGHCDLSLSLVSVEERRSYPLQVEQVVRSEAEKVAAKATKNRKRDKTGQDQRPRETVVVPKAARTGTKPQVELTPELKRIQKMVKKQLATAARSGLSPLSGAGWTLWQQQCPADGPPVWSASDLQTAA